MNLLYHWVYKHYSADESVGNPSNFALNQNAPRFGQLEPGESVWAFTRRPDGAYALAAELVVAEVSENEPDHPFGRYRAIANPQRSRFFDLETQQGFEKLVQDKLSIKAEASPLGRAFQGPGAVRELSANDHANLQNYADGLPTVFNNDNFAMKTNLSDSFNKILDIYINIRQKPFRRTPELWSPFEQIKSTLTNFVKPTPNLQVQWSVGSGNWARVPWIAVLDSRVTTTIRDGVYCAYLFREDMSGVYLTFTQGVSVPMQSMGRSAGREALRHNRDELRNRFPELTQQGFSCDTSIELGNAQLGKQYEVATITHKLYSAEAIPTDSELLADLQRLLQVYEQYAASIENSSTPLKNTSKPEPQIAALQAELPTQVIDLPRTVATFAEALQSSGISFGSQHQDFVRTFLASLATKRFAILTGLSGSGKTQIALKFGQWIGPDRFEIIPVRPDWTGAEALFGYEDALTPTSTDGRRGWAVPRALEFMLRAHHDENNPYLLILDEMNLAHVERYFADILSGMESGAPTLPNLYRESDGFWRLRPGEKPHVPVPSNLFIVGTVNIDETTYTFSPKVLDRANTLEFRVSTDDLVANHRKPGDCPPGPTHLIRGFLEVSRDDGWHRKNLPAQIDFFTVHLRSLHRLLSEAGFEFGHRVFFEAIRFAAIYVDAGQPDILRALDRQIMQKILPRQHGSRRRLEPTLCALAQFCFDLSFKEGSVLTGEATIFDPLAPLEKAPQLPLSFDKVRRMTRNLRANQFTSFTE